MTSSHGLGIGLNNKEEKKEESLMSARALLSLIPAHIMRKDGVPASTSYHHELCRVLPTMMDCVPSNREPN